MKNLNRFGRLGWHGGKLVLRVLAILVPVVVGVLWSVVKLFSGARVSTGSVEDPIWHDYTTEELIERKIYVGEVPWPENGDHYAWNGHYGDYVNEKWR